MVGDKGPRAGAREETGKAEDAAGEPASPGRRTLVARRLVERAAAALRVPTPTVRVDDAARERTEAHGAAAVMSGGEVLFHPERFDPDGADALETAIHELVHVEQLGVAEAPAEEQTGEGAETAEEEAREIAAEVVAGAAPRKPRVRLRASEAADKKGGKKKPKPEEEKKADEPTLPEGVNHKLAGTSGQQIIRTAWYLEGSYEATTKKGILVKNPDKMEILTRELAQLFWWMSEAQIKKSRDIGIDGPISGDREFMRVSNATTTFRTYGLPPDTNVVWKKEDDDSVSLILSIRALGIDIPPDAKTEFEVSDELNARIDEVFTKTFGVAPQRNMLGYSTLYAHPDNWAWTINYDKAMLENRVGPDWVKAKNVAVQDPSTEDTSVFGGMTFPNYISIEDRKYFLDWMEKALGKQSPTAGAGNVQVDDDLIRALKRLDENTLLKEKVIERMRAATGAGHAIDARGLRRMIHETEEEEKRIRLGLATAPEPPPPPDPSKQPKPYTTPGDFEVAPRERFFERPIYGKIVNLGSMASVGKSMDFVFETEDRQGIGFVSVNIDWYASPVGDPTTHARKGHTRHYAHHATDKWSVSFDKVGKYEITAFVDHDSYWPASFTTYVEVKTEKERLDQVSENAFGTFNDKTQVTDSSHFFEVSWSNDRFGPNKYTFGDIMEGELPDDWEEKTLDERLGFMADDKAALEKLIKQYEGSSSRRAKDIVSYAKHAIETMDSTRKRIEGDVNHKDGHLTPFEVRGAFLSEQNGVRSGDLNLIGLAGERHKVERESDPEGIAPDIVMEWDQPTVKLHDLSQLYETKNAVYTGEGGDFRASAEKAFLDLCKSYPAGRVSVLMEERTSTGGKTGKTYGFQLHTGTKWKDVKETVWDSKVQLIVNLAAAAAAIFIPGPGTVVAMALVTAYNAVDTIDNLATLHRKGQATWKDDVEAAVTIGLDLVPFLGEMKQVGRLGKSTLFALDVAQVATNVVILTDQGMEMVRGLRDQYVIELARLSQELEEAKAAGDSNSVEIQTKEREINDLIEKARGASVEVFGKMAKEGAVMLMAPLAFNHMLKGFAKGTGKDLANTDMFVEEKGKPVRYDPETGKIRGDKDELAKLTPERLNELQEAYLLDVYAKHADAANILGVRTEEVVIKRDKSVKKTKVEKNADGIWEVTAPEHRTHAEILDDVWSARSKLPDAPTERPKALERGSYEPTFDADEIIKIGKPIVVGNRIESRSEAEGIMQALAEGDRAALKGIGLDKLPKGFDPRTVEWGLGVLPDGKYVIIRGDHGAVDWGPFPEVRPLAHTHPYRSGKKLQGDGGEVGIHVLDMVSGGGVNEKNKVSFFPSAADVAFCVRNGLGSHTVHTPYVHAGKGKVGNPTGGWEDKPRVSIEIVGAQRVGSWEGLDHIPAYQAHLVVRDGTGKIIWEGEMIAVHHPSAGSLIMFGDVPAGWLKPGLGGGGTSGGHTPAPTRKPRNDVEEQALADWQALEKSGKNYGGKYDSDIWYDRYNDGLRYDLTTDRWYRPDGRKVKDPQKFDSKKWTKKKVYDHLAGDDSTSTFKKFAEMLIDEGIATRAKIEKKIEELGFLGRDEDVLRHELKAAYHDEILAAMKKPKTEQGKFEAMRRITERLDSSDKGNLTEDWYKDVVLGGKGETHVAARKDALSEDQGIEITKNRYVDVVESGGMAHEIKSGEGKLSADEITQMRDYARMVDGEAKLAGGAEVKHVRYSFTSPSGSKANVETMRLALTDKDLKGRISFEVFNAKGERFTIKTEAQLDAQTWLFE